jgi:hypothetical protein
VQLGIPGLELEIAAFHDVADCGCTNAKMKFTHTFILIFVLDAVMDCL